MLIVTGIVLFIVLFVGISIPLSRTLFDRYRIKRWSKALNLPEHTKVFNQHYQHVNGFMLSRQARKTADAFEYTYGEIDFVSFIALLSLTHPSQETHFYDLGSGVGKAVIACAMVYAVKRARGIELFAPLHHAALAQQQQLAQHPDYGQRAARIEFIQQDFLTVDLHDATLIFINSTGFMGTLWQEISDKLAATIKHATIITISKPLAHNAFMITKSTPVMMSWGVAMAYIQQKKR